MPVTRSGGASRNMNNGNAINKQGGTVPQFQQKAVVKASRPMKVKKQEAGGFSPSKPHVTAKTIGDEKVLVAKVLDEKVFVSSPNKLPKSKHTEEAV